MKFVFCTEPIYQYYRAHLYDADKDKLDKQLLVEYGDYKDIWDLKQQQDALPENIFVAELTSRDYPRNPWNYVSQLINKLTYQYLIDSPEFENIFSEILFNQSEREFYEFYKAIDRFYNGSEIFITVGNDDYSDMVTQMVCSVLRRTYGIRPQIIYDIDDVHSIRDDIDFSPEGAQIAYLQRHTYLALESKSTVEPLRVWYPFDMNSYTNALE